MKSKVYNKKFEAVGEVDLKPAIFEVVVKPELVENAIRVQNANSRNAISNTLTKGEVRGGGKKPWKQKGTGNARAGSIRSPLWRHGGITFGPRSNRNFSLKINKKELRKAMFMVLSDKVAEKNFFVFDDMTPELPKTKNFLAWMTDFKKSLAKDAKKFLFILPGKDENLQRSTSNLKNIRIIRANSLNTFDLIDCDAIVAPKSSLAVIEKTYIK